MSPRKSVAQCSPPTSMTSSLESVTFKWRAKCSSKRRIKNFEFMSEILFLFLGFADFNVPIVIEI